MSFTTLIRDPQRYTSKVVTVRLSATIYDHFSRESQRRNTSITIVIREAIERDVATKKAGEK